MSTTDHEIHLIERVARLTIENTALKAKIQQLMIEQDLTWVAVTNGLSAEQIKKIREQVRDDHGRPKGSKDYGK